MRGTEYLLAAQNEDGSWGDPDEENIRRRCHTTWTAIDGLRTYAWRGERLTRPEVKSMLRAMGAMIVLQGDERRCHRAEAQRRTKRLDKFPQTSLKLISKAC